MSKELVGPGGVGYNYGIPLVNQPSQLSSATPKNAYNEFSKVGGEESVGFKDLVSSVSAAGVAASSAPVMTAFGPSGLYEAYKFAVNDYVFLLPYHVNHDIKRNGKAYIHIHWSSSGTNIQPVKWEVQVSRAKGHNQANFGAPTTFTLTQTPHGTAWRHMIVEASESQVLILTEPDELINCVIRRVTNGGVENTDSIFGLTADLHYEALRAHTPYKVPNFYGD
jgi:hypothetical protein